MKRNYMKKMGKCMGLLAVSALLAGCGQQGEAGAYSGAAMESESDAGKSVDTAGESVGEAGASMTESGDAASPKPLPAEASSEAGSSDPESSALGSSALGSSAPGSSDPESPDLESSDPESPALGSSDPECSAPESPDMERPDPASPQEKTQSAQSAYAAFLEGDISLFDDAQIDTWALDIWKDTILSRGELEYTYLDLDGDGTEELLVQWIDEPGNFNGVVHYDNGSLVCWQFDCVEMTSGDYPLKDGAMVSQYDYSGASSYTIFRYQSDGGREEISTLFVREELIDPKDTNPCPYYEVDGNEVDKFTFDEKLRQEILDQTLERGAWTEL